MIISYLDNNKISESLDSEILDKYTDYVNEHKEAVKAAFEYIRSTCPDMLTDVDIDELENQITTHDDSKFSKEEFEPYANKWFGDGVKTPEYEEAWVHHWQSNPHHPEYWQGEDMPKIYILEMICDWLSFGIKKDNLSEIFDFYNDKAKDDPEKMLSSDTKQIIEDCLAVLENTLKK